MPYAQQAGYGRVSCGAWWKNTDGGLVRRGCAGRAEGGDRGTVFGRRRWRTPWSSGTSGASGEPWSPGPPRATWAPKTTRSPWAEPALPAAEPNVHTSEQPSSGEQMTSEAPSEAPSGATHSTTGHSTTVHSTTVKVIPPGATPPAGTGTAPSRPGAPGGASGVIPSQPSAPAEESTGSPPESADPPRPRVIRIPAPIGGRRPGGSASAASGTKQGRRRSRSPSADREAASGDAPPWERVEQDGRGRTAPIVIVIAVAVVCALLGGLAAFTATLGGSAPASPRPAASIAPAGATAPGARAGTGATGTGVKHTAVGHRSSGHPVSSHTGSDHTRSSGHPSNSGHDSSSRLAPDGRSGQPRSGCPGRWAGCPCGPGGSTTS